MTTRSDADGPQPSPTNETSKRDEVGVVVHTKILLLRSET